MAKKASNELEVLRELAQAVSEMRASQKLYFRYRNHSALESSKQAEKRVDVLISKWENVKGEVQLSAKGTPYIQPKLMEV